MKVLTADAVDPKSVDRAAEEVKKTHSALDLVIYNSGVLKGFGNMFDVGIQPLKENIDVNVYGAYYTAAAFAPLLLKSTYDKRSLVFVTSTFGSLALSLHILAAHEELQNGVGMGSGFDATAMYNVSKVHHPFLVQLKQLLTFPDCFELTWHPARSCAAPARCSCAACSPGTGYHGLE